MLIKETPYGGSCIKLGHASRHLSCSGTSNSGQHIIDVMQPWTELQRHLLKVMPLAKKKHMPLSRIAAHLKNFVLLGGRRGCGQRPSGSLLTSQSPLQRQERAGTPDVFK